MARLVLQTADGQQVVELRQTNSLGRHPSNTIQLLDKIVSKEHCIIEQRGNIFVLRDLGSLNGTFVNRDRVQGERDLSHGDEIAGYCWTCVSPLNDKTKGLIGMIGVVPDYRGRGVSKPILLAGIEYLQSIEVAEIGLQVDGSNTPAIRLYTSVGFEKRGELHWFERKLS